MCFALLCVVVCVVFPYVNPLYSKISFILSRAIYLIFVIRELYLSRCSVYHNLIIDFGHA